MYLFVNPQAFFSEMQQFELIKSLMQNQLSFSADQPPMTAVHRIKNESMITQHLREMITNVTIINVIHLNVQYQIG